MIFTTTPSREGDEVETCHGTVAGEIIMGADVFRDFMASIDGVTGGRSSACESKPVEVRSDAVDGAGGCAEALVAVAGIDFAHEVIQQGMPMVAVAGAAVTVSRV